MTFISFIFRAIDFQFSRLYNNTIICLDSFNMSFIALDSSRHYLLLRVNLIFLLPCLEHRCINIEVIGEVTLEGPRQVSVTCLAAQFGLRLSCCPEQSKWEYLVVTNDGISSNAGSVPEHCGEEGAKQESKALYIAVSLNYNPHIWPWALDSYQKNEIMDLNGQNEFPFEWLCIEIG